MTSKVVPIQPATPEPLEEERGTKGEGSIYQRGDGYWFFSLKHEGRVYTKSLGRDEAQAKKNAVAEKRKIMGRIERGEDEPKTNETVTVGQIADLYILYAKKNLKSGGIIEQVINANLKTSKLWNLKACKLGTAELEAYRANRESQGANAGTINNELSYLRAAFFRAKNKRTPPLVKIVPAFPIDNVENHKREGFLEDAGYKKILSELPDFAKTVFVLAYHLGCRRSEILGLKWDQVYLDSGYIDLQKTKNGQDRIGPIYGDMAPWLKWQLAIRNKHFPETETVIFHHENSRLAKAGDPVGHFYGSWNSAVERAGYKLILHDLRRTACRNMVQKVGISRAQAKLISGHLTDSMFDRYNIVDPEDAKAIGKRMAKWMKKAVGSVKPPELTD